AYRQRALADCLEHTAVVEALYSMAVEAVDAEKDVWGLYRASPRAVLSRALRVVELFVGYLKRLRHLSDEHADEFSSDGFSRFFKMTSDELDDDYFAAVETDLGRLHFRGGMLVSAGLGPGNTATGLVLHRKSGRGWKQRVASVRRSGDTFEVSTRDDAGLRVLEELEVRSINEVANALAQSAEHIRSFFTALKAELAFYIGCINLRRRLAELGEPCCLPGLTPPGEPVLSTEGLYDAVLALRSGTEVVGNNLSADGKSLVVVTGANQGGKSTFLRSAGLAQLMAQAGMFVAASRFRANVCGGVFTHFKREEDPSMKSGKLDEELRRMSTIANAIAPGCLLLCNESFASTNEKEGSEIALEVVKAMTEAGVKVFFVTHLFELADRLHLEGHPTYLFLRAPRQAGPEPFKLVEGAPEPTAYGQDLYRRAFEGHP
ncbi:MAG: MutS-related protein, partial [Acidimicrobiales bacterium]